MCEGSDAQMLWKSRSSFMFVLVSMEVRGSERDKAVGRSE